MGLISGLLTLPIAPARGAVWVAEQIHQEAERQWSDPAAIQAELSRLDVLRESGEIDEAEAVAREEELVQRLIADPNGESAVSWSEHDDA
jgi:hypothetical protein